jgi:hypothetical protein
MWRVNTAKRSISSATARNLIAQFAWTVGLTASLYPFYVSNDRYREERNRRKKSDSSAIGEALIFSSIEKELANGRKEEQEMKGPMFSELSFTQDPSYTMHVPQEAYYPPYPMPQAQNLQLILAERLAEAQRWKVLRLLVTYSDGQAQYRKLKYKARELGIDTRGGELDYYSSSSSEEDSFHTNFMMKACGSLIRF